MATFFVLSVACLISGLFAAPGSFLLELPRTEAGISSHLEARQSNPDAFQNWSEGGSNIRCVNGPGGSYTADWDSAGGFVCGKGWNGAVRTFEYSGRYNATGPGYLCVYGWTRNPLIEYYIVESHADLAPNEPWTPMGNFTFEEGTYEIFTSTRVNKPSIDGDTTFQQFWSVRSEMRVGGTVTTSRHVEEWAKLGMTLGNNVYSVLATEGYTADGGPGSSGSASITVG